jgi:thiamine biosynthesis lipoprotein
MQLGAAGALVNANGDVVVSGDSPQGGPWIIGIENPIDENVEYEQIRIVSGAVATSSRVHQKWEQDGKQVHHLVNPHTGSTAVTSVLSATVICGNGADAEALAKVPFILEIDSALNFIAQAGAECLIIDESLVAHRTKGWHQFK